MAERKRETVEDILVEGNIYYTGEDIRQHLRDAGFEIIQVSAFECATLSAFWWDCFLKEHGFVGGVSLVDPEFDERCGPAKECD